MQDVRFVNGNQAGTINIGLFSGISVSDDGE